MLDTTKLREEFDEKFGDKIFGPPPFEALKIADEIADFFISKFESHQKSLLEEVEKLGEYEEDYEDGVTSEPRVNKAEVIALLTKNLEK